jgi:hypothetical protein
MVIKFDRGNGGCDWGKNFEVNFGWAARNSM